MMFSGQQLSWLEHHVRNVGVESSNLFCSIALLFSTPDGNRRRAFFISVQHGGNRRLVTSASQRRQRTENLISLKNPYDFGLKRDFFSADSPLVKSMTSTTIKTLDLYYFSPLWNPLGEFQKGGFEYEKCHEQRSGVVIQRKLLPLIFCLRRILTEGTSRRPFSRA